MTCKRSRSRCGEVAFWRLGVVELDALLCYFDVAFGEEDLEWSGGCFKVVVEGSAVLKGLMASKLVVEERTATEIVHCNPCRIYMPVAFRSLIKPRSYRGIH